MDIDTAGQDEVERPIEAGQAAHQAIMAQDTVLRTIAIQNVNAEEVSPVVVEVIIEQEDAEQFDVFDLVDEGSDYRQRQPYILDMAEVESQGNAGDEDQTIPDEMHRFTVQFTEDPVSILTNAIPAPTVAAMRRVVDEDELEHLHHMFA